MITSFKSCSLRHISCVIEKDNGPRTVKDVKLISAGRILENNRTVGECKSPLCDIPGGVTTMHVVVQPPAQEKGQFRFTKHINDIHELNIKQYYIKLPVGCLIHFFLSFPLPISILLYMFFLCVAVSEQMFVVRILLLVEQRKKHQMI